MQQTCQLTCSVSFSFDIHIWYFIILEYHSSFQGIAFFLYYISLNRRLCNTLVAFQANMESIMRNRELTETRMMQVNWLVLPRIYVLSFFSWQIISRFSFYRWFSYYEISLSYYEIYLYQALREELASVERRAEEERAAHNATKMVCYINSII